MEWQSDIQFKENCLMSHVSLLDFYDTSFSEGNILPSQSCFIHVITLSPWKVDF